MKNKLVAILLIFGIIYMSCGNSDCKNSEQYKLGFKYYQSLKSNYKGKGALVGKSLRANLILASISGIDSKASYGDVSVYAASSDFYHDLKRWREWINKESCKVDLELLIDKEAEVISNTKWIE